MERLNAKLKMMCNFGLKIKYRHSQFASNLYDFHRLRMGQKIAIYKNKNYKPIPEVEAIVQNETVSLRYGVWNKYKMKNVASLLHQWKLKSLWLNGNKEGSILKQLYQINFPFLQKINLNDNRIESIEGISKASFPSIQLLVLDRNKILSISELKKSVWPTLSHISIDNNKIKQASSLTKARLCKKMKYLKIEYWCEDENQCEDVSWIIKMDLDVLRQLWIQNRRRICQNDRKVDRILHKKFQELYISGYQN